MYVQLGGYGHGGGHRLALRCPHCGQNGTFEPLHQIPDVQVPQHWLGMRRCPNPSCQGQLFFVATHQWGIEASYPALRVDFDATQIPDRIKESLSEAVTCHAEKCYVAAAIMIRRCLEELCEDRGAAGGDLKTRIAALRAKIVLPNELFEAMDELRILGNDAAHVEAKVYDDIGEAQVAVGLELVKEVLKATYQMDGLVKRLKALKKP